tara:strand:+ start:203 stop:847 length:645 start_codon:yes stop_codon:yes gene_type:complete
MRLTNEFYYFLNAIPPEKCEEIIGLGQLLKFQEGVAGLSVGELTKEERKTGRKEVMGISPFRDSGVAFANNQDLYDLVFPFMIHANKEAGWGFDIKNCETPQITQYKKGQFYDWHADGHNDRLSVYTKEKVGDNEFLLGNVRKLSMTILLNDGYKGGQLQFKSFINGKPTVLKPPIKSKGSIVVFPSGMLHRVTPVTEGARYSVVAWFVGPPFK